jgi:hypothetical protein
MMIFFLHIAHRLFILFIANCQLQTFHEKAAPNNNLSLPLLPFFLLGLLCASENKLLLRFLVASTNDGFL